MQPQAPHNTELQTRPLQIRRELLRTQEIASRIARDLESTSDWLLCARKAARLCVPAFANVAFLDLFTPGSSQLARIACARSDQALGERFEPLKKALWSQESLEDLQSRSLSHGPFRLTEGPAFRQLKRWTGLSTRDTSFLLLPLPFRAQTLGYLTLIRASQTPAPIENTLREIADVIGAALGSRQSIELLRADINQKDLFFSAATHDLRHPLTTLMMHLDLLKLQVEDALPGRNEPGEAFLPIFDAIDRLNEGIQSLYDCTQMQSGTFILKRRTFDLGLHVQKLVDASRPLLKSSGNEIQTRLPAGIVGQWDPAQLSRVVNNLIQNATKYAPRTLLQIAVAQSGHYAILRVRDHGPGIHKSERARVFDSFFRTRKGRSSAEGLGLGLFICKTIVEAHGGSVGVLSPEGKGTEFVIQLPLSPEPKGESQ